MKSRKKQHLVGTTLLSSEKTRSRKNNRLQDKIAQKWPPTVEEKFRVKGLSIPIPIPISMRHFLRRLTKCTLIGIAIAIGIGIESEHS
jgi:hypothetical protein